MGNTRNEPGSTGKHIFLINNTHADLSTNLGTCQLGIETDNLQLAFKDHLGNYHQIQDAESGLIAGSNGLLQWYSDNGGATVKLRRRASLVSPWVDTGVEYG